GGADDDSDGGRGVFTLPARSFPDLSINHKFDNPLAHLQSFLREQAGTPVLICSDSPGRRETLLDLLRTIKVEPQVLPGWQPFLEQRPALAITVAPID